MGQEKGEKIKLEGELEPHFDYRFRGYKPC